MKTIKAWAVVSGKTGKILDCGSSRLAVCMTKERANNVKKWLNKGAHVLPVEIKIISDEKSSGS